MTVITAVTVQNTTGVKNVHYIPAEIVEQSLAAVFEDMPVDVVKTGMLGSATVIEIIARAVEKYAVDRLVVDPVSSGFPGGCDGGGADEGRSWSRRPDQSCWRRMR